MSKICIVHQNDGSDVRVGKVCRTLSKQHDVFFLGWDRDGTADSIDLGNAIAMIFRKTGSYGVSSIGTRIQFIIWVLVRIFSLRPATVIAVNEELAFPLLVLKPFLGFKLIIDIHDPLADRVRKGLFHWIFRFVQSIARYGVNLLLVTDENRFQGLDDVYKRKAKIIPNFPNKPNFDVFKKYKTEKDNELRVAYIGSLNDSRGANILRAAVAKVGGIRIELAGWYTDSSARQLGEESYAHYNGILGMQDSLRLIASCDLVFCFYTPEIKNNINASPNKIYEAICMGKRCIINSETKIASWVVTNNFGYACAYYDVDALSGILKFAKDNISAHRTPNEMFLEYAEKRYYWEIYEHVLYESV